VAAARPFPRAAPSETFFGAAGAGVADPRFAGTAPVETFWGATAVGVGSLVPSLTGSSYPRILARQARSAKVC